MANKKINQLVSKTAILSTDIFGIGDATTGQLFKKTIAELQAAIGGAVISVNGLVGTVVLDTDDIQELASPTNKYFTDARARGAISLTVTGSSGASTYSSGTGVLNVPTYTLAGLGGISATFLSGTSGVSYNSTTGVISYSGTVFTDASIRALFSGATGITYNSSTGAISYNGTVYTDASIRALISITTTGTSGASTYNNTTGVINVPNYTLAGLGGITASFLSGTSGISYNSTTGVISTALTQYTDALARASVSLTTTGTSGASTYNSTTGVLNIPQYAAALSGTTNYIPKFTSASAIGNSIIFNDATGVGIGTINPSYTFHTVSANTTIGAFRNSSAANGQLLIGNTVGDLALRILASGDSLIFSDTSKYLAFGTNGASERMRLDSSGNFGIGTTGLTRKLTVFGETTLFNGAPTDGAISPGQSESITIGFNLAAASSQDISTINVTLNKWKVILRGGFADNFDGGTLVSQSLEIEVDSSSPTINLGNTSFTFSRNSSTSKLQVTNNAPSHRITFVGAIQIIDYPQSLLPTSSKVILGNVSIGNTNNTFKLDVTGTTRVSGVLTLGSTISNGTFTYTLPGATGTLALTSALSGYLPLTGGTLTGALTGTSATFSSAVSVNNANIILSNTFRLMGRNAANTLDLSLIARNSSDRVIIDPDGYGTTIGGGGTLQFTGASTFSSTATATAFIPSGATVPTNGMYLSAANTLNFATASTNRLTISSTGNLGLAITPSAWAGGFKAIQILGASFVGDETIYRARVLSNAIYDGSYKYLQNNYATQYLQNSADGVHSWFTAPSGTAGNAITFTQAMTLNASGNLGIGTASPIGRFDVIGSAVGAGVFSVNTDATRVEIQSYNKPLAINRQGNNVIFNEGGGNVGIGTTTPAAALETLITSTSTPAIRLRYNSASYYGEFLMDGNGDFVINTPAINGVTSGILNFKLGGTNAMRLFANGNFTVNTATDSGHKLNVNGTGNFSGALTGTSATFSSSVTASSLIKSGGTSAQYLMADGSVSTLTNPITGTGTANYIPKFTSGSALGLSQFFDNGTQVGIGTASPIGFASDDRVLQIHNSAVSTSASRSMLRFTNSYSGATFLNGSLIGIDSTLDLVIANAEAASITFSTSDIERGRITSGGNWLLGTTTNNGERLYVSGDIRATGTITANSDIRIKSNITKIENALEKVGQISGYTYNTNYDEKRHGGVIAQEIDKVFPEIVNTGNDGLMGVEYGNISALLIEAIKEQKREIDELRTILASK